MKHQDPVSSELVIEAYLRAIIGEQLSVDPMDISAKDAFFSLGVTSLISEEIRTALGRHFAGLSSTVLFEQPNLARLVKHLAGKLIEPINEAAIAHIVAPLRARADGAGQPVGGGAGVASLAQAEPGMQATQESQSMGIAVIGLGCRLPKAADPNQFWRNLKANMDCVGEVPPNRWDSAALYSAKGDEAGAIKSKWGGFIDDLECFDPLFFRISHKEAEQLDPQQKLFLQCAWEAMEDGGYGNVEQRPTNKVGVYVGVTWNEFSLLAQDEGVYQGGGSLYWGIPNRVSYFLNLTGPSQSIDTACSSSLVAIHNACRSLMSGECEMAIAGGVNLNLHPAKYRFLSQNHFLSSEGKCRSFGEGGDGYVPGEGVGAVLLKPLHQAIQDKDHIYGVIRGSATNHGGKVTGYTVPNPDAHGELVSAALKNAQVDPKDVDYIECHGTGTELGDPIEIRGLVNAFGEASEGPFCRVGSVKSNIGHLEAAAGVAGLIKILLCMRHETLTASLHSERENSKIDFGSTPFSIVKQNTAWPLRPGRATRLAGLSSFGAGGSNAHVVVESHPDAVPQAAARAGQGSPQWVALSAQSAEQLMAYAGKLAEFLDAIEHEPVLRAHYLLADIAHTLAAGRTHFAHRLLVQADSLDALRHKLRVFKGETDQASAMYAGVVRKAPQQASRAKSPQRLAAAWVQGELAAFPFEFREPGRKLPLPTYPFLKERSWPHERMPLVSLPAEGAAVPSLHPLVDVNVSTLRAQAFRKTLLKTDYYLKDHLVNDEHVVPGVCHLEMATAAARLALESGSVELKDVWFTNVIAVRQASRDVQIAFVPRESHVDYFISAVDDGTAFSRGKISRQRLAPEAGQPAPVDLRALHASMAVDWDIAEVYRKFGVIGIIQKQTFQVLRELKFKAAGESAQALAVLALDKSLQGDFERYSLHPTLMDGAVQTAMMLLQFALGTELAILPFHFSSVRQWCPMSARVHVHCTIRNLASRRFDLKLYDDEGVLLVEINDFILKEMKAGAAAEASAVARAQAATDEATPYYRPIWEATPALSVPPVAAAAGQPTVWALGADAQTLQAVSADPAFSDARVIQVQWGQSFQTHGPDRFEVDGGNPDHIEQLCVALKAGNALPQEVLCLAEAGPMSDATEQDAVRGGRAVFLLCKALMTRVKSLSLVYQCDGQRPADLALSGFFKTLTVEKPSFRGRVVQTEGDVLAPSVMACLRQELRHALHHAVPQVEVSYMNGQRAARRWLRLNASELPHGQAAFKEGGVYLITGGMGAIGLMTARHLSERYRAQVFLTGRSALDEAKQGVLQAISALGGKVRYVVCDIGHAAHVGEMVQAIVAEAGRLDGILHSAGVVSDDFILKKSLASFDKVTHPKVLGTMALDVATRDVVLDFFAVFSSVTAILGNVGQCDYGLGNAFADHFAAHRQRLVEAGQRSGRSVSINWPYWRDGGMVLSEREQAVLAKGFGLHPLETARGMAALEDSLRLDCAQVAVMQGDDAKIAEVLGIAPEHGVGQAAALVAQENMPAYTAASVPAPSSQALAGKIESYLKDLLSDKLKIPLNRLEASQTFDKYGLDSIAMIELIGAMEGRFANLPKTLFFEHQSIEDLVDFFAANYASSFEEATGQTASVPPANEAGDGAPEAAYRTFIEDAGAAPAGPGMARSDEPIAIIGLAGRYPMAADLDAFWENLKTGRNCVSEVPPERWSVDAYYQAADALKSTGEGKIYARWGSFLSDVDKFDPAYFNITPKEAQVLDPQERLFLEAVTTAIEDAGYRPDKLDHDKRGKTNRIGVYVGSMWGDYQLYGNDDGQRVTQTPQSFYWSIANRISYFFNFSGPSFTVDSACSSSLTALKLACDSLRSGECSVAIAGAVNLSLHPQKYALLSRMKFLATDGTCRAFGEGGNGYVPGEGVGAVVLKPLSQALRDRDHIYGVIRSGVLNHGGKTSGFTVPNPAAQGSLVKDALNQAGLSPQDLSYLEAHGTGTDLGDPVEIAGLVKAFDGAPAQSCPIGSVKSNYGHLEAAAGMIALTKVLLQFKHRTLVPSIHAEHLNPKIKFEETPFVVQRDCTPWPRRMRDQDGARQEVPRIAGISSFGAGGSNAHFIIEEAPEPATRLIAAEGGMELITYSARTDERLDALLAVHERFLASLGEGAQAPSLADMAYTLNTGRVAHEKRIALVVRSRAELLDKLRQVRQMHQGGAEPGDVCRSGTPRATTAAQLIGDRATVDTWLRDHNLANLALIWAGGVAVDWERLYEGQARARVSLPGYPFARERHWIETTDHVAPRATSTRPRLHMWLDENVSTLAQQKFIKTFRADDVWLAEHKVHGRRVLPGVVHLEMARAAITLSCAERLDRFDDVAWLAPVYVDEGEKQVFVKLMPQPDGGWFEISTVNDGKPQVHAYGRFRLQEAAQDGLGEDRAEPMVQLDLSAIQVRCPARHDVQALYEHLRRCGLDYGAHLRVTRELVTSSTEALAWLAIDGSYAVAGGVHPALLDGALRATLAIGGADMLAQSAYARVPVAIDSVELIHPIGRSCLAYARVRPDVGADDSTFDVALLDEAGRVLGRVSGLMLKPLLGSPAKAASASVPSTTAAPSAASDGAIAFLKQAVAKVTKLLPERVSADVAFPDMGIDSLMILELNDMLENRLGKLSKTLFYEYPNIRELAGFLTEEFAGQFDQPEDEALPAPLEDRGASESQEAAAVQTPLPYEPTPRFRLAQEGTNATAGEPIAVIGFSGMFPQAPDVDAFWSNLKEGRDCIEEIPANRWNHQALYEAGTSQAGKVSGKWGGFVPDVDCFDASFFQVPPVHAKQMDPQERLFLQVAWEAMERAGYSPAGMEDPSTRSRDVGVFVGFMWSHYGVIETEEQLKGNPAVGITWNSSIANRVSHFCDFKGPSYVVDIACASSLMAVHLACESLRRGECAYAIAGGVNLTIHPTKYKTLTQMTMLASDGRCKSFGADGDGYVPGEGVGALLLKPLSQALADGDTIHMTILSSSVNHGGRSNGYTVPSPDAQSKVITQAMRAANVSARDISYVETHGTGTALGDPIEVTGLSKCFAGQTQDKQFCAIGSVKSNIGHLESAAGIASLMKVLLQMKHGQLVPSLHSRRLNPHIDFERTPFFVQQTLQAWQAPPVQRQGRVQTAARTALVNSFAAGGTNVSMVVQEHATTPRREEAPGQAGLPQLVLLSAKREQNLKDMARRLLAYLDTHAPSLVDLARTLQTGREAMSHRLAIVAADLPSLRARLQDFLHARDLGDAGLVGMCVPMVAAQVPAGEQADIDRLLGRRDWHGLARHWLKGYPIHWAQSHDGHKHARLALPTYPFTKERHWMTIQGASGVLCAPEALASQPAPSAHPMLDGNASTLWRHVFHKRFDKRAFFLADHLVQGKVVLPGVAYLEMARFAGQAASPEDRVARLANVMWMVPMQVDDTLDAEIELRPQSDHVVFEVASLPAGGERVVHAQGEIRYAAEEDAIAAPPQPIDVAALQRRLPHARDGQALYRLFAKMGFGYGPSYVVTDSLQFGEDEALGVLKLPAHLLNTQAGLPLHPSIMDAALRSTLGLDKRFQQGEAPLVLPFSLGELRILRPLTSLCYAYVTRQASANPEFDKYNIQLLDDQGAVAVDIRDFSARRVRPAEPELGYYQTRWETSPLLTAPQSARGATLLLVGGDAGFAQALGALAAQQGKRLLWAQVATHFAELGPDRYDINPGDKTHWTRLMAAISRDGAKPDQIVHAAGHALASPWDDVPLAQRLARLDAQVDHGLRAMLWSFQAFVQTFGDQPVRCLYCHEQDGQAGPQHEMIASFARSLTALQPKYEIRTLNMEPTGHAPMAAQANLADAVMSELACASFVNGGEVRYVGPSRMVRKVVPYVHDGRARLGVRQGGVYLVTGGQGKLGRAFCRYLAQHARAKIALIGRSASSDDTQRFLAQLARDGASDAVYIQADTASASDMGAAVETIVERLGLINGVLHCAGSVATVPANVVSAEVFNSVLASKLAGTVVLDQVTRSQPLELFVLFSSLSALVGDFGYGGYAAANRFMDGFATLREKWHERGERSGRTLSIGWPLWLEGGMDIPKEEEALYFGYAGMKALDLQQGLAAFEQVLAFGQPHLAMVSGDAEKIHRVLQIEGVGNVAASIKAEAGAVRSVARSGMPAQAVAVSVDALSAATVDYLKRHLGSTLELPVDSIDVGSAFESYGMDSVLIMKMNKRLQDELGDMPKTALFEYNNIRDLSGFLMQRHGDKLRALLGVGAALPQKVSPAAGMGKPIAPAPVVPAAALPPERSYAARMASKAGASSGPANAPVAGIAQDRIAIVGVSGRYPQSPTLADFWRHVQAGTPVTGEIPPDRWDAMRYFNGGGQPQSQGSRSRWGGFIEGADLFDAAFFGMSPGEAARIDPQVRLMLETVWHTVEDAGYTPQALKPRTVGVYLGVQYADFSWLAAEAYLKSGEYVGPGCMPSELANHVSYFMDFTGPSLTVETGCSSALTCLHLAKNALLMGDCEVAIAGGVNLSLHHGKYLMLNGLKVLSPQGVERTFDDQADGYVPSEGVGAVLLKRLSQAVADGDHIYGVLAGSGITHAGTGAGQYLPNIKMLEHTFDRALQEAGLRADQVQYIESHGTGTELGDPIELKALANRMQRDSDKTKYCAIGTKANLGHLESASGICSLTKVLLSMQHGRIAPCAHLDKVNASVDTETSPFYFPKESRAWHPVANKRIAGINSFGLGGANAFVLIESAPQGHQEDEFIEPQLFILSAQNEERLNEHAQGLLAFAEGVTHGLDDVWHRGLRDAAYTLQVGRQAMAERLAIVAASWPELAGKLKHHLDGQPHQRDIFRASVSGQTRHSLRHLLDGAAGAGFLQSLMAAGQLAKVALAWTEGVEVDWAGFYAQRPARRVPLPRYPFARTPCRLLDKTPAEIQAMGASPKAARQAAPPPDAAQEAQAAFVLPEALHGTWFGTAASGQADGQPGTAAPRPSMAARKKRWKPWLQALPGAVVLDGQPQAGAEGRGAQTVDLSPELIGKLQVFSHRFKVTPRTLIQCAWAMLVGRYIGARRVTTLVADTQGVLYSGTDLAFKGSTADWLMACQTSFDEDRLHALDNLVQLRGALAAPDGAGSVPSMVAWHTAEQPSERPHEALVLCASLASWRLRLDIDYDRQRFGDAFIERLAQHLVIVLEGLSQHPQRNPAALSLQTRQEKREQFWTQIDRLGKPAQQEV